MSKSDVMCVKQKWEVESRTKEKGIEEYGSTDEIKLGHYRRGTCYRMHLHNSSRFT